MCLKGGKRVKGVAGNLTRDKDIGIANSELIPFLGREGCIGWKEILDLIVFL